MIRVDYFLKVINVTKQYRKSDEARQGYEEKAKIAAGRNSC